MALQLSISTANYRKHVSREAIKHKAAKVTALEPQGGAINLPNISYNYRIKDTKM
jgi:hypothetical protein